jgi:type I restriction enzyme, S subunit
VEWKTLGEITLPTSNINWKYESRSRLYIDLSSVCRENGSITETQEITSKNAPSRAQKLVEKNDVIFATTRPTQLRLSIIEEDYAGAIASTGYCVLRANSERVLAKWIYYHLSSSKFKNYTEENQSGVAYPAISDQTVKDYRIPIPFPNNPDRSKAEQARIVAILDKFNTLTHSISEGLPREIKLRQTQYEYYRNLLLNFPKSQDVA